MKTSLSRIPALTLTLPCALFMSCGGDASREALPDWGAGYDGDGGTTTDGSVAGGKMALATADDIGIPVRLYDVATLAECAMEIDGTREGRQDMSCRMEINELDLTGYGLVFDLHVPEGGCDWLKYWHYMYEAFETQVGPDVVSWTIDDLGNYTNEVNSRDGVPFCLYDYKTWSDSEWPNCCLGSYTLTVTDFETTVPRTYPPKSWDGKPSECYDGAAFADDEAVFSEDGWPLPKLVHLRGQAYHKRFELGPSVTDYFTNVAFANYYDPADHDGTTPAGLAPTTLAEPYYNILCLDHAAEVLGSIRLVVREWNEERESFPDGRDTVEDDWFPDDGDPDTIGSKPGVEADEPFPIDDYKDWKEATAGSDVWIEDRD